MSKEIIYKQDAIDAMGKAEWAKERLRELPFAQPEYYGISDIDDMWEYYAEEHDLNLTDNAKQIKEAMWIGYQKGKKDAQPDRIAIAKEKILQCISELEENSKYHAAFIQRNAKFITEGLRMALDFMKEGEEE